MSNNVIRLRPKWRRPLNELETWLLRPYVRNPNLAGHISDAVRRVTAARERQEAERERQRLARFDRVVVDDFSQRRSRQVQCSSSFCSSKDVTVVR